MAYTQAKVIRKTQRATERQCLKDKTRNSPQFPRQACARKPAGLENKRSFQVKRRVGPIKRIMR